MEPAERVQRLVAAVADALAVFLVAGAGALALPEDGSAGAGLAWLFTLALVGLLAGQLWLLATRGQTVGKILMGIRIVRHPDGGQAGFVRNVLLRSAATLAIGAIPMAGALYGVADLAFIFRADRRCLHDLMAGTRVVKAEARG